MQMSNLITAMRRYFELWFHKRNIIIVSEHKVKHIPISGGMQFIGIALLAGGVCWASYSTGCLMAARTALKEQTQALRTITNNRVADFAALTPSPGEAALDLNVPDSAFNASSLDSVKLFARVAFLERQVTDLQNANTTIIERVRAKTSGHIDDLEDIIKQTGLSPSELKKEARRKNPLVKAEIDAPAPRKTSRSNSVAFAQGGPYIPASALDSEDTAELFSDLDELAMLRKIVSNLPLGVPMKNGDMQSGFGHRVDPFTRHLAFHSGLDISGPARTKIYSTADGKVVSAGRNGMYGNAVDIDHGNGISTRYGHMSEILVQKGQTITKGDVVGVQGSTGRSTGPHLHYEVRYRNQPMNPRKFLEVGQDAATE